MTGFRDRLHFDAGRGEYLDGGIRYLMLRPDALMGVVRELPEAMRQTVLEAFARSITAAGGNSARSYVQSGAGSADALLRVIEATAPELGWGIWQLARDGDGLALTVENSPFAAGYGSSPTPVCHPIKGMLGAIGPMTLGGPVSVEEVACAACGAPRCRFEVKRVAA